jgi:signal transduction histidine kinase
MIQTLQRKFTVTAMIAVTVLLVLLLGGINLFNAVTVTRESDELLDLLAAQEDFGPAPRPEELPNEEREGFFRRSPDENDRMSALTFSVRFDGEGALAGVNLKRIAGLSEEEAETLGRQALESGQTRGSIGSRRFRIVQPAEGWKTVVFLDLSSQNRNLTRIAFLSLLGGAAAWLAMLLLVRWLSRLSIRPVAENMARQRQFITDAGHELKTPLAIIQANAEALELTGGENKYSRNIRAQVTRLTDLTGNLLTLAKFDEAGAPPELKELSFSELCRESFETFRAPAELKGLHLETDIAPDAQVSGSREQLRQLLSILLDNAVKYSPAGGTLSLSLRRDGRGAVLRVANSVTERSGDPERFFDRFYRADASRSRETGGYGIGLSAAKAIVQLHKGSISAAYEGERIVFTVRLP